MNNKEIKNIPSIMPFIIAGGISIVISFILPMYKLWSYGAVAVVFIAVTFILKKLNVFKDTVIEVEKPVLFKNQELKEIVELADTQIKSLKQLSAVIEQPKMVEDIRAIILTSQGIVDYVIENEDCVKKVRKYFRYYLEEIVKIVKQYDEFEEDTLNVEHVKVSKEKIENTLSNANKAFLKFYNDLYEGKAMDVSVDIKVFEGMLERIK